MKKYYFCLFAIIFIVSCKTSDNQNQNNKPQVPIVVKDEETAKEIAEKAWIKHFKSIINIKNERPYIATLIGDSVWEVHGSFDYHQLCNYVWINNPSMTLTAIQAQLLDSMLCYTYKRELEEYCVGVAFITIRKSDGAILDIGHWR